jgi:sortase A
MRPRRIAAGVVAAGLAVAGLWHLGGGAWIYAKAALAQVLLEDSWERTRKGEDKARPWPWADTWPVARLRVPRLDVSVIVLEGASGRTLAFGPGHHQGTPLPGRPGNSLISAHRDTHFRFLKDLEPGDEIRVEGAAGTSRRYRVTGAAIVDRREARLAADDDRPRLTLVTCYPFDAVVPGGPLRYLVFAEAAERI